MILIGDEGWSVTIFPDRKRYALHKVKKGGSEYRPVAYFKNEEDAKEFGAFLDSIATVTKRKAGVKWQNP